MYFWNHSDVPMAAMGCYLSKTTTKLQVQLVKLSAKDSGTNWELETNKND